MHASAKLLPGHGRFSYLIQLVLRKVGSARVRPEIVKEPVAQFEPETAQKHRNIGLTSDVGHRPSTRWVPPGKSVPDDAPKSRTQNGVVHFPLEKPADEQVDVVDVRVQSLQRVHLQDVGKN